MNDKTKDAIELWRETAKKPCRCLDCTAVRAILAHIDGEPARLAAAREEQREACALDAEERVGCASTYDEIRSVPLDATPLADELRDGVYALKSELAKARRERDDALAALRHARSVIPHGLPGSLYAVARGVADAVLEEHKEGT